MGQPVEKRRGVGRHVVDDQVGHDVVSRRQLPDAVPRPDPWVDLRVVDGVEPGVGAVDRHEERQEVDAGERAGQLMVEEGSNTVDVIGQPIGVGDQDRGGAVCVRGHGTWPSVPNRHIRRGGRACRR